MYLETERLLLRPWNLRDDGDLNAALGFYGDADVRRYFPKTLSRTESQAQIAAFDRHRRKSGFCFNALVLKATGEVIGHHGLHRFASSLPFYDACSGVEIGWTLAKDHWRQGYGTEMGLAVLNYARETLSLPDVVAFSAAGNRASMALMERLGLSPWTDQQNGAFLHPSLDSDHPLALHRLYRIEL